MISEEQKYLKEGQSLIKTAFDFEDYILRRSFGLYYIGWAVAFFLYTIPGLDYPLFTRYNWILPLFYISSSLVIMLFTGYVFSRAARVSRFLKWFRPGRSLTAFILFFAYISIIVSLLAFFGFYSYFILLYIFLGIYVPWAIFNTMWKSGTRIHIETWVAVVTFVVACAISIAGIQAGLYYILTIAWIVVASMWFVCGVVGLYDSRYKSMMINDDE